MKYYSWNIKPMLLTICSLLYISCPAQEIDELKSEQFEICWAKTYHLVFPVDVKYFSLGDENVVGEKVERCPNVIRLKANVRDFEGTTNLSVVTADSKYYSYCIRYVTDVTSPFRIEGHQPTQNHQLKYTLPVCDQKLSHIIFPSNLIYIDYGDTSIEVNKADGVENIVTVKAAQPFNEQTNLSVMTEDDKFYTFNINYQRDVNVLSFLVDRNEKQENIAILDDREMNILQKDSIRRQIADTPALYDNLDLENGKVRLSIENIMIKDNTLFFKMSLDNFSQINYDIDFIRFYIQDSKKSKRTAEQQIELVPLFYFDYKPQIKWQSKQVFTVALEKFTIPDKKECIIEIQEKGGGRHFAYKLKNKYLIDAQVLLASPIIKQPSAIKVKNITNDSVKSSGKETPVTSLKKDSSDSLLKKKINNGKKRENKNSYRTVDSAGRPIRLVEDERQNLERILSQPFIKEENVKVPPKKVPSSSTRSKRQFNYFEYIDAVESTNKKKN